LVQQDQQVNWGLPELLDQLDLGVRLAQLASWVMLDQLDRVAILDHRDQEVLLAQ
jgi:hypothetical protein